MLCNYAPITYRRACGFIFASFPDFIQYLENVMSHKLASASFFQLKLSHGYFYSQKAHEQAKEIVSLLKQPTMEAKVVILGVDGVMKERKYCIMKWTT